jgi:dTDP-4-dehydrorhamnose reductase
MMAGDLLPVMAKRNFAKKVVATNQSRAVHQPAEPAKLDITKRDETLRFIAALKPELVINCAAYTNVDKAESDYPGAIALNALGPLYLAEACRELGIKLVHISTDYVFNGGPDSRPFKETDPTTPVSVYGWTKYLGEEFIRTTLPEKQYLILRTSWLHGVFGNNFVDTIYNAAKKGAELKVVDDQFGGPTWTGWLAGAIADLCEKGASGLFHVASKGVASRFAQAEQILKAGSVLTKLAPQLSSESARPAPRPVYSVLDVSKLEQFLDKPAIRWEDGIAEHLSVRIGGGG